MSRLFTFGCSFTNYLWPTWSAIMAYDQNFEIYNYALPGLGNVGIANRVLEADLKHKFKDDDIICIMWSSWDREDRIVQRDEWRGRGSVFVSPDYGVNFLKNMYNETHSAIQNIYAIHSINVMYKDKISWQGKWKDWFQNDDGANKETFNVDIKIKNLYMQLLPDIYKWNVDYTKLAYGYIRDPHPVIMDYLNLLKTEIYPKLQLTLNEQTERDCLELSNILCKNKVKNHYIEIEKLIDKHNPKIYTAMKVVGPSILENLNE